jgi:hypothetical protein
MIGLPSVAGVSVANRTFEKFVVSIDEPRNLLFTNETSGANAEASKTRENAHQRVWLPAEAP